MVQLPSKTCVAEPELLAELRAAGKLVIANSPVRRVLAAPDEAVTPEVIRRQSAPHSPQLDWGGTFLRDCVWL